MINNNGTNPADLDWNRYGNFCDYDDRVQELQVQIKELVAQHSHLEMLNRTKDRKIAELECLVYPWSSEGEAICNSDW